mmetsp:Transcript_55240/g.131686  ORF Transcript_55240/g.131686 Transcript_55240/m.131686 type:complete len:271 (-) Transcript_55240:113-925(-)
MNVAPTASQSSRMAQGGWRGSASAMESEVTWYVVRPDQQESGPYSAAEMRRMLLRGDIMATSLIRLPKWPTSVPVEVVFPKVEAAFEELPDIEAACAASDTRQRGLDEEEQAGSWGSQGSSHSFAEEGARYVGYIKSFSSRAGYGFISCEETSAMFGRDVFIHKAQLKNHRVNSQVSFEIALNRKGHPQAKDVRSVGALEAQAKGSTAEAPQAHFPGTFQPDFHQASSSADLAVDIQMRIPQPPDSIPMPWRLLGVKVSSSTPNAVSLQL